MTPAEYRDRMLGCWLGKNLGGALGAPLEGRKNPVPLPPGRLPKEVGPNDDLDLQLVWLELLEQRGVELGTADFADFWRTRIRYPYDEYGIAKANLERGLKPPRTGVFNNFFADCMGSPIRSEIWACLAPGLPATAAHYAALDAQVDHGTEGIAGEIFLAALESRAFLDSDFPRLVESALRFVPIESELPGAVRRVLTAHRRGVPLNELRTELVLRYDRGNFSHALLNLAFIVAGLSYAAQDFTGSMITAINLGYDTDCTGATAGAIAGILLGAEELKRRCGRALDHRLVVGPGVDCARPPATVEELTDRLLRLREQLLSRPALPQLSEPYHLPTPEPGPDLQRSVRVGAFACRRDAENSEHWAELRSPVDVFELSERVEPGKKLFLRCRVTNPAGTRVRLIPHANVARRAWLGDEEFGRGEPTDFAPSPHRWWNCASAPRILPPEGVELLVELAPAPGALHFALLVARDPEQLPEIHARITI